MQLAHHPEDALVAELRRRVATSIAIEEAMIEALAEGAGLLRKDGRESAALEAETFIRRHRVGVLKQRAILGAHGIEV